MTTKRAILLAAACALVAGLVGTAAHAKLLSNNPITMVVPYPPGAAADITMRLLTDKVTEQTGQVFVIRNVPGGGLAIAAAQVKGAAPDGHTLLQLVVGTHATTQRVATGKPPYDLLKDFTPIMLLWNLPQFLAVPQASPARSISDLVALAKSKPNGLSFGSVGANTAGHFLGQMLAEDSKTTMLHVPYKGAAPALIDLIANRIDFMFASYSSLKPFADDNKLRALAVASPRRLADVPAIPTMADAGFPNVTMTSQFGLAAPANTPQEIVRTLNEAFKKAMSDRTLVKMTAGQGLDFAPSTPAEFTAMIVQEFKHLDRLLKPAPASP
jgi:tripartite-type tricarboxylate transporter receptor subunit TctC